MNRDQLEGSWKQIKGTIREQWGKLTDDDMNTIHGKYDQLVGRIQKRYGREREDAEHEVDDFLKKQRLQ